MTDAIVFDKSGVEVARVRADPRFVDGPGFYDIYQNGRQIGYVSNETGRAIDLVHWNPGATVGTVTPGGRVTSRNSVGVGMVNDQSGTVTTTNGAVVGSVRGSPPAAILAGGAVLLLVILNLQ
jgi:hypothetical protein